MYVIKLNNITNIKITIRCALIEVVSCDGIMTYHTLSFVKIPSWSFQDPPLAVDEASFLAVLVVELWKLQR